MEAKEKCVRIHEQIITCNAPRSYVIDDYKIKYRCSGPKVFVFFFWLMFFHFMLVKKKWYFETISRSLLYLTSICV